MSCQCIALEEIFFRKNVQFIDYGNPNEGIWEGDETENTSKVNVQEAYFVYELAKYFIKNGVDPSKITILTFYLGQFFEIRKQLQKLTAGRVNCQTVDNYQGQENDIIILSTVRSNREKRGGFRQKLKYFSWRKVSVLILYEIHLNGFRTVNVFYSNKKSLNYTFNFVSLIDNRVCVALSRARNSLFVVGNLTMLSEARTRGNSENIWEKVTDAAYDHGNYRNSIQLACSRHPEYKKEIPVGKTMKDTREAFQMNFPEGGCVKEWLLNLVLNSKIKTIE